MIIVIVLIAIIGSYAIPKFTNMSYKANITTLKSQLALIQTGIANQKNKNILLSNTQEISSLDNVASNNSGEKLFTKVIDFSIVSTNNTKKEQASAENRGLLFVCGMRFTAKRLINMHKFMR